MIKQVLLNTVTRLVQGLTALKCYKFRFRIHLGEWIRGTVFLLCLMVSEKL